MLFSTLAAALLALPAGDTQAADLTGGAIPAGPMAAVTIDLDQQSAAAEYFLVTDADIEGGTTEGAPIAVVALRSIERSSADGPSFLLEREVVFATGGLRVRHTETGHGASRRLVWREFLPDGSRTWIADWTSGQRGAAVRSIAYGWNRPVHERVMTEATSDRQVFGPLELLLGARDGDLTCGEANGVTAVIDPSAAAVIECHPSTTLTESGTTVDLRRMDGTLLLGGDFGPAGESGAAAFTALRFSGRDATVEPIDRIEFERLNSRWSVPSRRAHDAILAHIPDLR